MARRPIISMPLSSGLSNVFPLTPRQSFQVVREILLDAHLFSPSQSGDVKDFLLRKNISRDQLGGRFEAYI